MEDWTVQKTNILTIPDGWGGETGRPHLLLSKSKVWLLTYQKWKQAYVALITGLKIIQSVHGNRHVGKLRNVLTGLKQKNPYSDKQTAERGRGRRQAYSSGQRLRQHIEWLSRTEAQITARNCRRSTLIDVSMATREAVWVCTRLRKRPHMHVLELNSTKACGESNYCCLDCIYDLQ